LVGFFFLAGSELASPSASSSSDSNAADIEGDPSLSNVLYEGFS
jgi:hypothetical protein